MASVAFCHIDEQYDSELHVQKINPKSALLSVLFIVDSNILICLCPSDCVDLLSIVKETYHNPQPWLVLMTWLSLENFRFAPIHRQSLMSESGHPRHIVLHATRRLGYNCTKCMTALTGPTGFFACTSLCKECSHQKFKACNSGFVDGVIRFYLCGKDSMITRGQAFLTHPYWISTDDAYKRVVDKYGSAFELAQRIYEEKMFFLQHAPTEIYRPRDDKPATIRRMIEMSNLHSAASHDHSPAPEEPPPLIEATVSRSDVTDTDHCQRCDHGELTQDWVNDLPSTLQEVFLDQKLQMDNSELPVQPLGTLPLRDLVQSMHDRFGVIVKYLV